MAEILNHKKLDTTRIYVRIVGRQKQEAVALLDALVGPRHALLATDSSHDPRLPLTQRLNDRRSSSNSAANGSSVTDFQPRIA